MPDRRSDRGRHQARKRAVDLLFEAEARGLTPAELADSRNTLAETDSEVSALNPYTLTVVRGVTADTATTEMETARTAALAEVDEYFRRALRAVPSIAAYLDEIAARPA